MPTFLHGKNTRVMFVNPGFTSQTFTASATNLSPTISVVSANFSLVPGMGVTAASGLAAGTVILSVTGNTLTLSNNFAGTTGNIVFTASSTGISYDISQFFNDVSVSFAGEATETTTFQTSGVKSFIAGLREGSVALSGFYDGTVNGVDAILNTAISNTSDEGVIVFPDGAGSATVTSRCYLARGIETKLDLKSPVSGVVAIDTEIQADGGVWRGFGQTFTQAVAATTYAPSSTGNVRTEGGTTNGGVILMGVTSLTGTSPTVALTFQHSPDGSTWTTPTGGDLATESGVGGVVTLVNGNIYKYTRLRVVLGGTSPSANIYYGFARF